MKRIIVLIISFVMVLSVLATSAFATEPNVSSNDIYVTEEISKVDKEMLVYFNVPQGLLGIECMQFTLNIDDAFTVEHVSTSVSGWVVTYSENTGRVVLMNDYSNLNSDTATLEEGAELSENGYHILTVQLSGEPADGKYSVAWDLEDVTASGQPHICEDEGGSGTFIYCSHAQTEIINAVDASCTEGYTGDTVCKACEKVIEIGEVIPASPTHEYNQTVCTEEYLETQATDNNPATYHYSCACGEKGTETFQAYIVTFFDFYGNDIYNAAIPMGESAEETSDIAEELLPEKFGYQFNGWDASLESINNHMTVLPTYERDIETKYTPTVNGEVRSERLPFDTKIVIKTNREALWTVNGQDFHIGETVTMYTFGDMDIRAKEIPTTMDPAEPFVSLIGFKTTEHDFVAFVHVYDPESAVTEYGASFWNASFEYDQDNHYNIAVDSGNDAMLILYQIKTGNWRGVKAYAMVGGRTIYSKTSEIHQF